MFVWMLTCAVRHFYNHSPVAVFRSLIRNRGAHTFDLAGSRLKLPTRCFWADCQHHCGRDDRTASVFLRVVMTDNTRQNVSLVFHLFSNGVVRADGNGSSWPPASWKISWPVADKIASWEGSFIGNQSKHWWCRSTAITWCNQHLFHNDMLERKIFLSAILRWYWDPDSP